MIIPHDSTHLLKVLRELNRNRSFERFDDVDLFRLMSAESAIKAAALLPKTAAQLRQDILVAAATGFRRGGYFVEFGATDGVYLSNTLLLERELGWTGILAEPARAWHERLKRERHAQIDTRCVFSETGQYVAFREVAADHALSTIVDFTNSDLHHVSRIAGDDYEVETISLIDLLGYHNAPRRIDYLSLDTEGSEYAILKGFDFSKYEFCIITCEHNYTSVRNDILKLLSAHGYQRVLNRISYFDDWYVHRSQLGVLAEAMPDWQSVSDENFTPEGAPLSEIELVVGQLQQTVQSLIVDRDAYKHALEEEAKGVSTLPMKTVDDLIVDRDAYKSALEEAKGVNTLLMKTVEDLIVDRDAYKSALQEANGVNTLLMKTVDDLIVDRDSYKSALKR